MYVQPGDFTDRVAGRIAGDGTDVEYPQAGAVVGLVVETIDDVLVMVDGLDLRAVDTRVLGVLQVTNVPDVGDRVPRSGRANTPLLVELVVKNEELLVLRVQDPALVSVGSAFIADARYDVCDIGLVRDIVNGQGVLIVAVADVSALVPLIRTSARKTLALSRATMHGMNTY